MSDPTPYRPIDCSIHDRLESLATLRRRCRLLLRDESGTSSEREATIVDVYTEAGAEYVRLDDGAVVRLDRIESVDGA